jgi:glycosyltransferase involved in cell wall biosynthesis
MPVRNGIKFAPKSLGALLPFVKEIEFIIVDDGSIDGSFEFCESLCKENSNLLVLKNPGHGISEALNYGIQHATGSWIARFDIDDAYDSRRLDRQIDLVNKTQCILAFSDYSFCADGVRDIGFMPAAMFSNSVKLSLISGRRTPHPAALFRKDMCLEAGGYLSEDSPAEDLSLWLRMQSLGAFASSDCELLKYRLAQTSITMQSRTLSVIKRRELLKKHPIDIQIFNFSINHLNETFSKYNESWKGKQRIVLHILDIYLYANTYKIKISWRNNLLMLKQLLSFPAIFSSVTLLVDAIRRYNFRKAGTGKSIKYDEKV